MAPHLLDVARLRYRGKVPPDCFLVNVPDWLRLTPDHTIAPAADLQTQDGVKWIKVSKHVDFVQACRSYCPDARQEIALHVIQKEARQADGEGDEFGLPNLFHDDEDEEEPDWEMRTGSATFQDLGVTITFIVTNYSVLWAKAEKHCLMMFMCDPMNKMLAFFGSCENLLCCPPAGKRQELEDTVEQSKLQLLFAMVKAKMDPHDVIHSLYPEMHTAVYQADCVHCDPKIEYADEEDPPETLLRLLEELTSIGFQENGANLSVEKAQQRLMCAEGHLEAYTHQFDAMHNFFIARENFRVAIQPVLHQLRLASHHPTVVGVSAMDLHDDDD
ncbi:unnamed protein product [Urochloa humidicola]